MRSSRLLNAKLQDDASKAHPQTSLNRKIHLEVFSGLIVIIPVIRFDDFTSYWFGPKSFGSNGRTKVPAASLL